MLSVRPRSHTARRIFFRAIPFVAALALSVAASATRSHADTPTGPHASANAAQPMRFVRVRSDSEACSPNCPEWISAEGKIVTGSADALERTLNAIGNRRLPIVVNSAGGSVRDAMEMGRLIRAKRLAVVVARTTLTHCPLRAKSCGLEKGVADARDAYCASACTLVLAAGVERYVSALSFVGVHQMTELVRETQVKRIYKVHYLQLAGLKLELSRRQIGEQRLISTAKLAADEDVDDEVSDYFLTMGVAEPVMKLTLATPSKGIHWLTSDELKTSRLATAWIEGPKPFLDAAQPSGLDGLAVDASADTDIAVRGQIGDAAVSADRRAPRGVGSDVCVPARRRRGGDIVRPSRRANRRADELTRRRRLSDLLSPGRRVSHRPPGARRSGAGDHAAAQLLSATGWRTRHPELYRAERRRAAGDASSRASRLHAARRRRRSGVV